MKRFKKAHRVTVSDPELEHESLRGKSGTVQRLLMRSAEAWVCMDDDIPDSLARFPVGDERRNHVCLWPFECEPERGRSW